VPYIWVAKIKFLWAKQSRFLFGLFIWVICVIIGLEPSFTLKGSKATYLLTWLEMAQFKSKTSHWPSEKKEIVNLFKIIMYLRTVSIHHISSYRECDMVIKKWV